MPGHQVMAGGHQVMLMHPGMMAPRSHESSSSTGAPHAAVVMGAPASPDVAGVESIKAVQVEEGGHAPSLMGSATGSHGMPAAAPTATKSSIPAAPPPQQPPIAMYKIQTTAMATATPYGSDHTLLVPYAQVGDGSNDDVNNARAMRKHAWTTQEDETLMRMVSAHGPGRWSQVASHLPGRMGKQCRERWFNHLAPEVRAPRRRLRGRESTVSEAFSRARAAGTQGRLDGGGGPVDHELSEGDGHQVVVHCQTVTRPVG